MKEQLTRLTAARDAFRIPDSRTKDEHRFIVWMNYQDLFKDRDHFEQKCDDYENGKRKDEDDNS
jgi:hypothetical protein